MIVGEAVLEDMETVGTICLQILVLHVLKKDTSLLFFREVFEIKFRILHASFDCV